VRLPITVVASLCLCARPLAAQTATPITIDGLGTISFPTATQSAAAESTFVRGVLLLHVFEYSDAAAAFRAAQKLDPGMALAYWGEAMTYTHPVWDEQNVAAGRAALARFAPTPAEREAKAGTARARGYLHAIDVLYGDGPKAHRDTLYSQAMAALLADYPHDDEARAFYALSLLGLSQGVRDVPTYLHAAAVAESVFARNPQIAPDAGHAQHMTSHIFMALGMWDDVVRANENAMRVVDSARAAAGRAPTYCGHYNFWLEYGYLQQGKVDDARTLMQHCEAQARPAAGDPRDPDNSSLGSAVAMWTRYVIDAKDWSSDAAQWTPDFGQADAPRATWEFTRGLAAAERGDVGTARAALEDFEQVRARLVAAIARKPEPDPGDAEYRKRLAVLSLELQAEIQRAATPANVDSALVLLRRATAVQDSMAFAFGPPQVDLPSHELLGEVLLGAKRFAEAEREFQAALMTTPGRVSVLEGLKRARAGARPN
jgi:tetratricopeptide (TPR) repeat protein